MPKTQAAPDLEGIPAVGETEALQRIDGSMEQLRGELRELFRRERELKELLQADGDAAEDERVLAVIAEAGGPQPTRNLRGELAEVQEGIGVRRRAMGFLDKQRAEAVDAYRRSIRPRVVEAYRARLEAVAEALGALHEAAVAAAELEDEAAALVEGRSPIPRRFPCSTLRLDRKGGINHAAVQLARDHEVRVPGDPKAGTHERWTPRERQEHDRRARERQELQSRRAREAERDHRGRRFTEWDS